MKYNRITLLSITCLMLTSISLYPVIGQANNWDIFEQSSEDINIIDVALFDDGLSVIWGNDYFENLLDNNKCGFEWQSNNSFYQFKVTRVYDEDIFDGTIDDYDVIIFGAVDQYLKLGLWKRYQPLRFNRWVNNIAEFIEGGGGYIGHCGGANLICELENKPYTFIEKMIDRSGFGIIDTKAYQNIVISPLDQLDPRRSSEDIGAVAYVVYNGMNTDEESQCEGGVPLDFVVKDSTHPILKGYKNDTLKIRWAGGPGLIPSSNADVILSYPTVEISESHPIHIWEFVGIGRGGYLGKWLGIMKSMITSFFDNIGPRKELSLNNLPVLNGIFFNDEYLEEIYTNAIINPKQEYKLSILVEGLWKASDWKKSDKIVQTNRKNMAAIVTETYGAGRIVISGPHPEDHIWDGGRIVEMEDTDNNSLWIALNKWEGIQNKSNDNCWFLRREVAWAAGLNEEQLPPIPKNIC